MNLPKTQPCSWCICMHRITRSRVTFETKNQPFATRGHSGLVGLNSPRHEAASLQVKILNTPHCKCQNNQPDFVYNYACRLQSLHQTTLISSLWNLWNLLFLNDWCQSILAWSVGLGTIVNYSPQKFSYIRLTANCYETVQSESGWC